MEFQPVPDPFTDQRSKRVDFRTAASESTGSAVPATPRKPRPSHLRTHGSARTTGHHTRAQSGSKRAKKYGGYTRTSDYLQAVTYRFGEQIDAGKPDHASRAVSIDDFRKTLEPPMPILPVDEAA